MQPITATADLADLCSRLRQEAYVTIDTEFMRDRTYYPKLCLVQIAGAAEAVAVDPLASGLDMAPFVELLLDERVLKVLHASRQDMEIFYHLCGGRLPRPVFDTQVAAQVCGFGEEVAYETLVTKLTKGRLDKSSRFTDWSKRPLTDAQLRYALGDVTHLRVVYEKLAQRIEKAGRTAWIEAEFENLQDSALYVQDPETSWQRLKVRSKEPRFVAIVRALARWRELKARAKDVPRQRILRDDLLMELAANRPRSVEQLKDLPRISLDRESTREVVDLVAGVLARPEAELPRLDAPEPPPKGIGPTVDLLRVLLKHCAEASDVAQRLIASTADLEALAQDDEAPVPALKGWRRRTFGEQALKLKAGRLALAVDGRQGVRLIELEG
ncbi:MAG: ribonuclease D [Geminicoccaceae bacterium]|nr:ribonuclease D [Geminicoccaceae bacterium]